MTTNQFKIWVLFKIFLQNIFSVEQLPSCVRVGVTCGELTVVCHQSPPAVGRRMYTVRQRGSARKRTLGRIPTPPPRLLHPPPRPRCVVQGQVIGTWLFQDVDIFHPKTLRLFWLFLFFFEEGGALRKTTFFPIQVRKFFAENKEKEEGVHSKNIFSVGKIKGKRQVFHPAVTIAQKCRPFSCLLQRTGYRYFNPIIYFERKIVRNVVIHLYFLFPRGQNKYVFFRVIKKTSWFRHPATVHRAVLPRRRELLPILW